MEYTNTCFRGLANTHSRGVNTHEHPLQRTFAHPLTDLDTQSFSRGLTATQSTELKTSTPTAEDLQTPSQEDLLFTHWRGLNSYTHSRRFPAPAKWEFVKSSSGCFQVHLVGCIKSVHMNGCLWVLWGGSVKKFCRVAVLCYLDWVSVHCSEWVFHKSSWVAVCKFSWVRVHSTHSGTHEHPTQEDLQIPI